MPAKRIVLSCQSLVGGNGGIARVDRLMARVLAESPREFTPEIHVFADAAAPGAARGYGGSRLRFLLGLWRAQRRPGWFLYDAAYLAKAHRWFPGTRRNPSMVFLHGIEIWEQARRRSVAAGRRADLLVANSDYTRDRAERCHGGFARARVCRLGTEESAGDVPPLSSTASAPVILAVGRMEPREDYKGHRELIEAWPAVLARHPAARLEFVGRGGLMPELKCLAVARGLTRSVEFAGFVPEAELAARYARATVFALPSRGEGFGLVYIEAMRHGLPVIASVHDAGAEIVEDERTGLLVNLDKPGDLAEKICQLLARPDDARRMGEAGRERWRREFTFEAFRGRFRGVLGEFLRIGA